MSKRRPLLVAVGVAMILAFAASCALPTSGLPETAPIDDGGIYGDLENLDPSGRVVVYWYQHAHSREELMLSMIDEFNRVNEWSIAVLGQSQGGYDDLHDRITDGIPTRRLPSIAGAYPHRAATYAVEGVLVALDPYVRSEKWGYTRRELRDFFPGALAADMLPQFGARYGWPSYRSMEVMYYNADWLAELGYEHPPETWEEFGEMACAAAERPFSAAMGEGPSYGYVYSLSSSRFAAFVFSRGGSIVNEDGTGYVFNDAAGLEAVTFLKGLVDRGCSAEQTERYGDQIDFGAGRSLFAIGSTSSLSYYRQAVEEGAGFNWDVGVPPHTTATPRMHIYGASLSIFQSTPEEQLAAWLFLKWLSEPEQQAKWAAGTGYFPVRRSAAALVTDYLAESPAYERALGFMSMDHGVEPSVAGYDGCRAAISEMLATILGGTDAQMQLDSTAGRCNGYLVEAAP